MTRMAATPQDTDQGLGVSPGGDRAGRPSDQAAARLGDTATIPDAYEAMVYSAYLPNRTVAFIFPESGIPFCTGMFRIEYLRPATEADRAAFPSPNADSEDEICPLCNRVEEWK